MNPGNFRLHLRILAAIVRRCRNEKALIVDRNSPTLCTTSSERAQLMTAVASTFAVAATEETDLLA